MLRIVTNVAEITHIAHCVALNTLCGITQKVSNYYTEKCQFFAFILGKFTPDGKKFTQAPPVVPVTNEVWSLYQCLSENMLGYGSKSCTMEKS